MLTISAHPSDSAASATAGIFIRFVVINGIDTSPINRFVTQVKPARGTIVAIVGILASCQPIPVLIIVAPLFSTWRASSTTSSHELPSEIRSSMESR